MGYTHYYYKYEIKHSKEKWKNFLIDVITVAAKFKLCIPNSQKFITGNMNNTPTIDVEIGDGMGKGRCPEFNIDRIYFNGVGKDSHETLCIQRDDKKMPDWMKKEWEQEKKIFYFCKTAYKPYDLLVVATLILYKKHFEKTVKIVSDGDKEDFEEGLKLVNNTLKYNIKYEDVITEE